MSLSFTVRCPGCEWVGELGEAVKEKARLPTLEDGELRFIGQGVVEFSSYFCPECGEQVRFE